MKITKILSIMSASLLASSTLVADAKPIATMKSNSQIKYLESPKASDSVSGMFKDGMFYGRLRSNTFYYWWEEESSSKDIHLISALGGSAIFKSSKYNGFDFGAGLYYSYGMFDKENIPLGNLKAGKDIISRFNVQNTDSTNMAVLGQAYLRYKPSNKSEVVLGRQIVESFYTKSNDTKMIPNTFDALVISSKEIASTYVKLGYLAKQKLRDHTQNHSVLMYGDANSTSLSKPNWSQNDDSAMHQGLTYSALKAAGKPTDSALIIGDIKNKSIKNLSLDTSFYVVPELLSQVMIEANYKIKIGDISVAPGIRYIKQADNGAGSVGGASLKADGATGYTDPTSLDAQMIAARVVTKFDKYKINLGYTNILDEADLVTPWRGFPTAGYTRSMARYNWSANTKSYRIELVRNTSSIGLYNDVYIQASVMFEDKDADKNSGADKDSFYYYIGFVQNVEFLDNAQWRYRFGYQDFVETSQVNNIDTRFELNYFF